MLGGQPIVQNAACQLNKPSSNWVLVATFTTTNDLSKFYFLSLSLGAAKTFSAQGNNASTKRHNNDASELKAKIATWIIMPERTKRWLKQNDYISYQESIGY